MLTETDEISAMNKIKESHPLMTLKLSEVFPYFSFFSSKKREE
jgi:hypothetical protein